MGLILGILGGECKANMFFSSSNYQKKIMIELLLLNKADLISFFKAGNKNDIKHSQLNKNDLNLIVQLKNIGNKGAWGTLVCNIEGYSKIKIHVPHLSPNMKSYANFVVPLCGITSAQLDNASSTLEANWEKLYNK